MNLLNNLENGKVKKMYNELYDLREFKRETVEMCAFHAVIQNMNQELENVRQDMNDEINKYKESSTSYEDHINHIYDNLTSKILESIESDFFNIGIYHFNIVEKISEFCDSNIMINLLKKKIMGLIKRYNIDIDRVYYYTHKSNEDNLIIIETEDVDYINHYENVVDLVCPYNEELYIECNCSVCMHLKSHIDDTLDL
jgi:hypothetical protein